MTALRQSALRSRHEELGATLDPCFGMDVPWSYDQDVNLEHNAVRNAAGLFDVSREFDRRSLLFVSRRFAVLSGS